MCGQPFPCKTLDQPPQRPNKDMRETPFMYIKPILPPHPINVQDTQEAPCIQTKPTIPIFVQSNLDEMVSKPLKEEEPEEEVQETNEEEDWIVTDLP